MHTFQFGYLRKKDHWENLDTDGRMLFKQTLQKQPGVDSAGYKQVT